MSGFFNNINTFMFGNEDEPYRTDEEEQREEFQEAAPERKPERPAERPVEKKTKKSNIIAVPSRKNPTDNLEIVLFKASSYDDMQTIANHIKERKVAVVNFEEMDKDVAQRMVDFLSGAVFALDGVPRKVSGATFIFSCSSVDLTGKIMEQDADLGDADPFTDSRFSSNQWLRS